MAGFVYILCAIMSFACYYMLAQGYKKNRFKLLFWSSLGFLGFALNNILLFVDQVIITDYDLSVIRTVPALIGVVTLLYGLISDTV